MVNFSYAVRVFKAELQSFLDLRIPIVKSVNSLEAEISPVIKNVRRFPATRNGGHIMLPHWKHLFLGQRKSIANMLAQGWRLKKIASVIGIPAIGAREASFLGKICRNS